MKEEFRDFSPSSFCGLCLLTLILGAVYVVTLLPGVGYSGDTAEFQFVGGVLGTPHPTGYPTYVMLNHLFVRGCPIGNLAYRANLLSAVCSITACVFLFRLLILLDVQSSVAFITSLTFGLTRTLWSQSVVAEVYALHILSTTVVLYFLLRWNKTEEDRDFLIACAVYALSFGNHLTVITLLPAVIYLVWATDKKVFTDGKRIVQVGLFIVVGALQYSYLFWRFYDPQTSFLECQTPNLEALWRCVTGAQFRGQMFSFSILEIISQRIPMSLKLLLKEYPVFLIPIAMFGITRVDKTVNLFLSFCFLGNVAWALNYDIGDIFTYFMPSYLVIAIYLGLGLDSVTRRVCTKDVIFTLIALACIPSLLFTTNFRLVDQHNNKETAREIEAILQTVERDAIIISPGWTYSNYFWYYLIGNGWEAKYNIYVMHHYSTEAIKSYINENKPFLLWEERKTVPARLAVYCISPEHKRALEEAGFGLLQVKRNLYRLEPFSAEFPLDK